MVRARKRGRGKLYIGEVNPPVVRSFRSFDAFGRGFRAALECIGSEFLCFLEGKGEMGI